MHSDDGLTSPPAQPVFASSLLPASFPRVRVRVSSCGPRWWRGLVLPVFFRVACLTFCLLSGLSELGDSPLRCSHGPTAAQRDERKRTTSQRTTSSTAAATSSNTQQHQNRRLGTRQRRGSDRGGRADKQGSHGTTGVGDQCSSFSLLKFIHGDNFSASSDNAPRSSSSRWLVCRCV